MINNSNELNFIYYFNKCLFLVEHIDIFYQKQILDDIKKISKELNILFSKNYFKNEEIRKDKLLETLNKYLDDVINNQILVLLDVYNNNKNNIINSCEKKLKNLIDKEKIKFESKIDSKLNNSIDDIKSDLYKNIKITDYSSNNVEYLIQEKIESFFTNFRNQIRKDIEFIINDEIYSNINIKIEDNNVKLQDKIENFLKIFFKDENFYKKIIIKVKDDLNEIYSYIENNNDIINDYKKFKKIVDNNENNIKYIEKNIFKKINSTFEDKIILLTNIFNEKISKIMKEIEKDKINNNNNYSKGNIINNIEEKFSNFNFSKNNFNIDFVKENNEIRLYYFNELITSTKINIKGMIGPKGPQGNKGDKGDTTIIRKIDINKDNTYKFTMQSGNNIYELNSECKIPFGPQGPKGEKGDPGEINIKLDWDQQEVMKVNHENPNSLIFLKSISIGENSHCVKKDSLSIGSGICYNDNSISLGNNSKTLDNNSVALFGSTIGKNSFSFMAENVQENSMCIGDKDKGIFNLENIYLNSKNIHLDCNDIILNNNSLKSKEIIDLEKRINILESKIL